MVLFLMGEKREDISYHNPYSAKRKRRIKLLGLFQFPSLEEIFSPFSSACGLIIANPFPVSRFRLIFRPHTSTSADYFVVAKKKVLG